MYWLESTHSRDYAEAYDIAKIVKTVVENKPGALEQECILHQVHTVNDQMACLQRNHQRRQNCFPKHLLRNVHCPQARKIQWTLTRRTVGG